MSSLDFLGDYTRRVEEEMRATLEEVRGAFAPEGAPATPVEPLYRMAEYHLGWRDERGDPTPESDRPRLAGKRLRPALCLLSCEAVGGRADDALSAAAAVEFVHNFSLIHDDIEDGDEARRHRPTVWSLWGIPQAINAGSNMQALVYAAAGRGARRGLTPASLAWLHQRLTEAILRMTEGQFLDMSFEELRELDVDQYWTMVRGKTAALVAAACEVGARLGSGPLTTKTPGHHGGGEEPSTRRHEDTKGTKWEEGVGEVATHPGTQHHDDRPTPRPHHPTTQPPNHPITQSPNHPTTQSPNHPTTQSPNHPTTQSPNDPTTQRPSLFARYGELFGLAFQARDDYLGVWGEPEVTGKPVCADIARRKKSLPVAFALTHAEGEDQEVLRRYYAGSEAPGGSVEALRDLLERLGAREYVQSQVRELTDQAFAALEALRPGSGDDARLTAFERIRAITAYALDRRS